MLDLTYLIGLRIGEEMSRTHLGPLCSAFFSGFDKATREMLNFPSVQISHSYLVLLQVCPIVDQSALGDVGEGDPARAVSAELAGALTPELAYSAYVAFYNLLGRAHLEASILNMETVRALCLQFQRERGPSRLPPRPATFSCLRTAPQQRGGGSEDGRATASAGNSASASASASGGGGNLLAGSEAAADISDELHNMVRELTGCTKTTNFVKKKKKKQSHLFLFFFPTRRQISREVPSSSRHLRGNWLAYWEHEIGRAGGDGFNLKQIRLQGFAGHGAGVRCLHVLDGENSFLTGSRDRTAKVWSLRSQVSNDRERKNNLIHVLTRYACSNTSTLLSPLYFLW